MPDLTADDMAAWMWLLWADAGHAGCAGWTFQANDRAMICDCGRPLWRLGLVRGEAQGAVA